MIAFIAFVIPGFFDLEVSEITVRRWVKDVILKSKRLGRNIVFDVDELKAFKKQRQKTYSAVK